MLLNSKLFLWIINYYGFLDNEVVKNTRFNLLKAKINKLAKEFPDATTLIHINTDKHSLEKNIKDVVKRIPGVSGLVTTNVLNTKISQVKKTSTSCQ